MNAYSDLLNAGASEVMAYYAGNCVNTPHEQRAWVALAASMKRAAAIEDLEVVEAEIRSILWVICDSFPMDAALAPSFKHAADIADRLKRRRAKARRD